MARFILVTDWQFGGPIEPLWEAICRPEDWLQWWKFVRRVEFIRSGSADGVGAERRYTWSSRLPYDLTFNMTTTLVEPPYRFQGEASGELSGRGLWTLSHAGAVTKVRYDWEVDVTRAWMRTLAPVLTPMFRWNHGEVMRAGAHGLSAHLNLPPLGAPGQLRREA